jgi:ABC-2 type transport system ATP-binding protein
VSYAVDLRTVSHAYGARKALDEVTFSIAPGEIFGLLGPNGGGKTTLFRLLSTLIPIQSGVIEVFGLDVGRRTHEVRRSIGVVFQAASLDRKLTVDENLRHQGHLYGLSGSVLSARCRELLEIVGLADRRADLVETLSGGLRRRVELAKGMLHAPRLLILDEPSTGLDPGARRDLWDHLRTLRRDHGTTVVLTTHLLEEADKADRLAILHSGKLVALDTPDRLRATVGGDTLTIAADDAPALAERIRDQFQLPASTLDDAVRIEHLGEHADGPTLVARLAEAFPGVIRSITLGKPTLEDVFIARTGRRFREEAPIEQAASGTGRRRGRSHA